MSASKKILIAAAVGLVVTVALFWLKGAKPPGQAIPEAGAINSNSAASPVSLSPRSNAGSVSTNTAGRGFRVKESELTD